MTSEDRARILCVDDEPNILEGLKLHLRRRYDVVTASSGPDGLAEINRAGPPDVVLSDMRMPGMDGAAFLSRVRGVAPDTVRLLLTGQADLNSCISAINEGQIFRFLSKPCQPEALLDTMKAAVQQYRLITSEKVLLEETLRGCIKTLIDVLALANPLAFGRASRIKEAVTQLSEAATLGQSWQVEVAAMLSHIGAVTLPISTAEKLYYGKALDPEEQKMIQRLPRVAEQLLANIPRLEEVRAILLNQDNRYDGSVRAPNGLIGENIPVGARALKIVNDYDALEVQGHAPETALDIMRSRAGWYDPILVEAFGRIRWKTSATGEIPLKMVQIGMVFAQDVRTPGGVLLIARGHQVTNSLLERILNFSSDVSRQRVRVITGTAAEPRGQITPRIVRS